MKNFFAELRRRNVIRIAIFYIAAAWLILQVSDVLLEIVGAPDGSLRLIAAVLALGAPFALVLAWAFEVTPEGIKRESDISRDDPVLQQSSRRLDVVTIGLLVLATGLLIWFNVGKHDDSASVAGMAPPRELSIAVLPFVNLSSDPGNEYFSDGLSEELLNVLARMDDFRVPGRTSAFAYKGQQQDLRAIGEQLNVAHILEGSVRKQGDRIRVTAQLIDARSGYHLWTDTYERRLDDVFAIQGDIATKVVTALRQTLLPADEAMIQQTAKGDVEAYNHHLRGLFHVRLRTRAGLERALEEFHEATLIDPDYAPPYTGIAMVYALLDNYGYRSLAETESRAMRALDRALSLDPRSDDGWAVRGMLLGQGPNAHLRRQESRAALERALEINPNNAMAHVWYASTLLLDRDAQRDALRRAYEIDPLSPVIIYRRAMEALQQGHESELARFLGELEDVAPDWFMTWAAVGNVAQQRGRLSDAAAALERAIELNPEYLGSVQSLAGVLHTLGFVPRAESILIDAAKRGSTPQLQLQLASLRSARALDDGDLERAIQIYDDALRTVEGRHGWHHSELALLEIRAGHAERAERRVRMALGVPEEEYNAMLETDLVLDHVALVYALAAQQKHADAARLGEDLRRYLSQVSDHGFEFNILPLAEAFLDQVTGHPGRLEQGLRESIRLGFRTAPSALRWVLPLPQDSPELSNLMAIMEAAVAPERERYVASQATAAGKG